MMSENISNKLNTIFPVAGGGLGAISQVDNLTKFFPSWEAITASLIITIIGATVGYLIKLLLDRIFKK
jgi:hypothetical protein